MEGTFRIIQRLIFQNCANTPGQNHVSIFQVGQLNESRELSKNESKTHSKVKFVAGIFIMYCF